MKSRMVSFQSCTEIINIINTGYSYLVKDIVENLLYRYTNMNMNIHTNMNLKSRFFVNDYS